MLQIEKEARDDDGSESNIDSDNNDSDNEPGQNEEYEILKAFNMNVKKDEVKPLFDRNKKNKTLLSRNTTKTK